MTATIQIGNTDDKLTQKRWSEYVDSVAAAVHKMILYNGAQAHFFAASCGTKVWQNACWVLEVVPESVLDLKCYLGDIRSRYDQDSVAFTIGEAEFI